VYKLNKHKEAIEFFYLSINIDPNNLDGYLNKGYAFMSLNKYNEAFNSI